MPLPPIIIIIVIASAVTAGTVAFNWKNIKMLLKGKTITVLGAKSTGKTTLLNFITSGKLDLKSTGIQKTKRNKLKLGDLEIYVKEGKDITGSEDFVKVWKKLIEKADYTFYMIHSKKVLEKDTEYISLIEKHLSLINTKLKKGKKLIVICSFSDLIKDFHKREKILSKRLQNILKEALIQVPSHVFIGSLHDEKSKSTLMVHVLKTLENIEEK
jgi:GTPase SAR1 family protein